MQRLFLAEICAHEYWLNGKKNNGSLTQVQRCKGCGKLCRFNKHGFYDRYYCCGRFSGRISVRRYICSNPKCNHTISLLPNFCHPKFIMSLEEIFKYLIAYFYRKESVEDMLKVLAKESTLGMSRQLLNFYKNRFIENLPYIESTLRTLDSKIFLPKEDDINEKAKKVLTTVKEWSCQINMLSQKFHDGTLSTFLCKQNTTLF